MIENFGFAAGLKVMKRAIPLKVGPVFYVNEVNEAAPKTGMVVRHRSDKVAATENASASFNGISLGKISNPLKPIYVGSTQVPATPGISFCTDYLESS